MLIFAIKQNDSVVHIYAFFKKYFLHYGVSQEIWYSSLCYTVGSDCLSILNTIVCIYKPQIPSPSLSSLLSPFGNHKSNL